MKIKLLCTILISIFFLNLTGCSYNLTKTGSGETGTKSNGSDEIIDQGPEKGGTVKLFSTNPDTLNPLFTKNPYIQDLSELIYEGLVSLDSNGRPVPTLAERWEVSEDKMEWTFHIRKSVLWHDRIPLTSDDVVYTYEAIRGSLIDSVYKANLTNLAGVSAIDKYTVTVKLLKPNSFTAELLTIPILPKHKHSGDDFKNLRSNRNMTPVGTGPFRFVSFKENSNIYLRANSDWWNKNCIKDSKLTIPYLETINIRIYPALEQALNSFHMGEVDVAPTGENTGNKYSYRNDLIIRTYTDRNFEFIALNNTSSLLKNPNIRKALAYAINKQKLVSNILPGEAVAADLPITPDTWLYNTDIIHYVPDAAKAAEILRKTGWINRNGIMMQDDKPLTFELMVNSANAARMKVAEEIRKQLAEVGIVITIKPVDENTEKTALQNKRYDMALLGCKTTTIPDISFMFATYAAGNVSGYGNPTVDSLLQLVMQEHDAEKKKELFSQLKREINEGIPYIGLYFKSHAIIYNKKLKGHMNPSYFFKHNNIAEWYIPGSGKQDQTKPAK